MTSFEKAVLADPLMAISHFQLGHLAFKKRDWSGSMRAYEETIRCMRGNATVEYQQTGLEFTLFEAEVWYNHGLCKLQVGDTAGGLQSFMNAHLSKRLVRHDVIEDALSNPGADLLPFSPPDLAVFRPKRLPLLHGSTSLLGSLAMVGAGGLHTPMPSCHAGSDGEMGSVSSLLRKVVAVTEGELRPDVYDFGRYKPMAWQSRAARMSTTGNHALPGNEMLLIKLVDEQAGWKRYTECARTTKVQDLLEKICKKLGADNKLRLTYQDGQGDWLGLYDEDDLGCALERDPHYLRLQVQM